MCACVLSDQPCAKSAACAALYEGWRLRRSGNRARADCMARDPALLARPLAEGGATSGPQHGANKNCVADKVACACERARARASPLPSSEACETPPARSRCGYRQGLDFRRGGPWPRRCRRQCSVHRATTSAHEHPFAGRKCSVATLVSGFRPRAIGRCPWCLAHGIPAWFLRLATPPQSPFENGLYKSTLDAAFES